MAAFHEAIEVHNWAIVNHLIKLEDKKENKKRISRNSKTEKISSRRTSLDYLNKKKES